MTQPTLTNMDQKQQKLKKQTKPSTTNLSGQSEMFSISEVEENTKEMLKAYESKPGEFSGAIIERNKEKIDGILELLAQPDMTHAKIARLYKVSRNTVASLERRAEDDGRLKAYTARLLEKIRYATNILVGSLIESIEKDELQGRDKGIVTGILMDHLAKLEGRPTAIVENRKELTADEFAEYMNNVKAQLDEKNAEVIDVKDNED